MNKTRPTSSPAGAAAPTDAPTYRSNPEADGKIDAHIKENPKFWAYVQAMPRERLERSVVLNEVRQLERQQRMKDGMLNRINQNPALKQAYETLVKDLPEDQREGVMTQLARQTQRAVARSKTQGHTQGV